MQAALRAQRERLHAARAEIDAATAAARQAGDRARADAAAQARAHGSDEAAVAAAAEAAAAPYEQTRQLLDTQVALVERSAREIDEADVAAGARTESTRALLRASLRALDDALRAQLELLVGLERAERARQIAEARQRSTER